VSNLCHTNRHADGHVDADSAANAGASDRHSVIDADCNAYTVTVIYPADHPNACSHADGDLQSAAERDRNLAANTYFDAGRDSERDANPWTNRDFHCDANGDGDPDGVAEWHADRKWDPDRHTHGYGDGQVHANRNSNVKP
jgi:hypothetical protein